MAAGVFGGVDERRAREPILSRAVPSRGATSVSGKSKVPAYPFPPRTPDYPRAEDVVFVAGMFVDYLKSEVQVWTIAMLASMVAYAKLPNAVAVAPRDPETVRDPRARTGAATVPQPARIRK